MSANASQTEPEYKPKNSSRNGTMRIPDIIETSWLNRLGHARPDEFSDAILGCGPHQLPNGRNY